MIQSINSQSLVRLAREGSAADYANALRETGAAVIGNAVEVFCAMDRETEHGRAAVDQLKDLKNSLIAHIDRQQTKTTANLDAAKAAAQQTRNGEHPTYKLEGEKTENLTNATALTNHGKTYENLQRISRSEAAKVEIPDLDEMAGVKKFLADLTAVQGLYTASVMIPGPLSATVKNVAKELYTSSMQSNSSASGSSHSAGAALSLLGVGVQGSDSSFASQSSASGNARYEKTTIDERVVPVLTELQDRLSQASVVPASKGELQARRVVEEKEGHAGWFGNKVKYDKNIGTAANYYSYNDEFNSFKGGDSDHRLKRNLETFEYQPEHVRLPETSISDYAGKK